MAFGSCPVLHRRMGFFVVLNSTRMLWIICFVLAVGARESGIASEVPADSSSTLDSSRMFQLREVLITATRLPQSAPLSAAQITAINQSDIEGSTATSLGSLLATVPGLFVKDYGGIGALQTTAQRGLGPEHTVVLFNGMRISNPQNNLIDLGLISSSEVERVEILHGGSSASFGADAVAGVVNVITKGAIGASILRVSTGFGSFGYRTTEASGGLTFAALSMRATYREERGRNDFPFVFRNGSERFDLVRQNADFLSRMASLHSSFSLDASSKISLFGRTYTAERGVAGAIAGPANSSVARQHDKDNLLQLHYAGAPSSAVAFQIGAQYHHVNYRYRDSQFIVGSSSLNDESTTQELRFEPGVRFKLGNSRVAVGLDYSLAQGSGNSLATDVRRISQGFYTSFEQKITFDSSAVPTLRIFPTMRFDRITTSGVALSHWSPQIGLVVSFKESGRVRPMLRANVSRNFSAPTFNMLYYAGAGGAGNPHLQPERSTNIDVGGGAECDFLGMQTANVSYFDIQMRDRIVWVSTSSTSVTPKNIRSVSSKGIELSYQWRLPEELGELNVHYTSLSTKKVAADFAGDRNVGTQLIYVPQETANFSISSSRTYEHEVLRRVGAAVAVSYSGYVFTTEDNSRFLLSYTLVNCSVFATLSFMPCELSVRLDANNVFDTAYQVISLYPMPGRSFRATVGLELSD